MAVQRANLPLIINRGFAPVDRREDYPVMNNLTVQTTAAGQKTVQTRPSVQLTLQNHASNRCEGITYFNTAASAANRVLWSVWGTSLFKEGSSQGTVGTGYASFNELNGKMGVLQINYGGGTGTLYYTTGGAPSSVALPVTPSAMGLVVLNRTAYLAAGGGIYNSSVNDITTWNIADVINAEMTDDRINALVLHNNHIAAFGANTIEFFYDNANPNNSPLRRRADIAHQTGTINPLSVATYEDTTFFVAKELGGDQYVAKLENFQVTRISTPAIESKLGRYSTAFTSYQLNYIGNCLLIDGKLYYVLSPTPSSADEKSWVYDTEEGLWYEWQLNHDSKGNSPFLLTGVVNRSNRTNTGTAYYDPIMAFDLYSSGTRDESIIAGSTLAANGYWSDNDTLDGAVTHAVDWFVVTDQIGREGAGAGQLKYMHEFNIACSPSADSVTVEWNDNALDSASWSTARTLTLHPQYKLTQLGSYHMRAFRISGSTHAEFETAEIGFTQGRR